MNSLQDLQLNETIERGPDSRGANKTGQNMNVLWIKIIKLLLLLLL